MLKEDYGKLRMKDSLSDTETLTNLSSYNKADWTVIGEEEMEVEKYDPYSDQQICCVELTNNNKIYIYYEKEWTIKDVLFYYLAYQSNSET